ncbi:MAG: hypothetical protein IT353_15085 [Gemmatimonadaceae bacterium]|nr:hypothetical protein [Gemmatimonadaceae bacterium]
MAGVLVTIAATFADAQPGAPSPATPDTIRMRLQWAIEPGASGVADSLGVLSSVAVDARGNSYVSDWSNSTIWTFTARGEAASRIGRRGDGPGEFYDPGGLAITPDGQLIVRDFHRYSRFALDARTGLLSRYVGGFRRAAMSEARSQRPTVFDASGALFDPNFHNARVTKESGKYYRYSSVGRLLDSLVVKAFPDPSRSTVWLREDKGGGRLLRGLDHVPFASQPISEVTARGTILLSSGRAYAIEERDPAGRVVQSFQRADRPMAIPTRERLDSVTALRRRLDSLPIASSRVVGLLPSVRRLEVPTEFPPFMAVYAAADGTVWVRRWRPASEQRTVFDVFNPDGHFAHVVVLPKALVMETTPFLSTTRIVGVAIDPDTGINTVLSFSSPTRP